MSTTHETLDQDTHGSPDATIEHPKTVDLPTASVDAEPPTTDSRRHWIGWALVGAALLAVAALAMSLLVGGDGPEPVGDAKDHAGYGQATPVAAAPVGVAKDHSGYGQVTPVAAEPIGDSKDHAGYGQATPAADAPVGDAKDHAGFGSSTAD